MPDTPELERFAALLAILEIDGSPVPALKLPAAAAERAAEVFAGFGDGAEPMLACFNASEPQHRWPLETFCAAIAKGARENGVTAPLLGRSGDASEQTYLAGVAAQLSAAGTTATVVPGGFDVVTLTGVLSRCRAFLGADAPLADLASGVGVAGATVAAGALWPALGPWAQATAGIVNPLPCFGCRWDCAFGHPVCLEAV